MSTSRCVSLHGIHPMDRPHTDSQAFITRCGSNSFGMRVHVESCISPRIGKISFDRRWTDFQTFITRCGDNPLKLHVNSEPFHISVCHSIASTHRVGNGLTRIPSHPDVLTPIETTRKLGVVHVSVCILFITKHQWTNDVRTLQLS